MPRSILLKSIPGVNSKGWTGAWPRRAVSCSRSARSMTQTLKRAPRPRTPDQHPAAAMTRRRTEDCKGPVWKATFLYSFWIALFGPIANNHPLRQRPLGTLTRGVKPVVSLVRD